MIRDKALDIFLMMLFGMGGITILILAWAQPMLLPERILTTSVGSVGLFWVLIRALSLIAMRARMCVEEVPAEVEEVEKKQY